MNKAEARARIKEMKRDIVLTGIPLRLTDNSFKELLSLYKVQGMDEQIALIEAFGDGFVDYVAHEVTKWFTGRLGSSNRYRLAQSLPYLTWATPSAARTVIAAFSGHRPSCKYKLSEESLTLTLPHLIILASMGHIADGKLTDKPNLSIFDGLEAHRKMFLDGRLFHSSALTQRLLSFTFEWPYLTVALAGALERFERYLELNESERKDTLTILWACSLLLDEAGRNDMMPLVPYFMCPGRTVDELRQVREDCKSWFGLPSTLFNPAIVKEFGEVAYFDVVDMPDARDSIDREREKYLVWAFEKKAEKIENQYYIAQITPVSHISISLAWINLYAIEMARSLTADDFASSTSFDQFFTIHPLNANLSFDYDYTADKNDDGDPIDEMSLVLKVGKDGDNSGLPSISLNRKRRLVSELLAHHALTALAPAATTSLQKHLHSLMLCNEKLTRTAVRHDKVRKVFEPSMTLPEMARVDRIVELLHINKEIDNLLTEYEALAKQDHKEIQEVEVDLSITAMLQEATKAVSTAIFSDDQDSVLLVLQKTAAVLACLGCTPVVHEKAHSLASAIVESTHDGCLHDAPNLVSRILAFATFWKQTLNGQDASSESREAAEDAICSRLGTLIESYAKMQEEGGCGASLSQASDNRVGAGSPSANDRDEDGLVQSLWQKIEHRDQLLEQRGEEMARLRKRNKLLEQQRSNPSANLVAAVPWTESTKELAEGLLNLLPEPRRPVDVIRLAEKFSGGRLQLLSDAIASAEDYDRNEYSPLDLLDMCLRLFLQYLPAYLESGDSKARYVFGNAYAAKESDSVMVDERMRQQREFRVAGKSVLFEQHLAVNRFMRIYFRVLKEKGVAQVAWVGKHMECATTS